MATVRLANARIPPSIFNLGLKGASLSQEARKLVVPNFALSQLRLRAVLKVVEAEGGVASDAFVRVREVSEWASMPS